MRRLNRFCWIIAGGALLLIAPAWAAAQDPVPSPPKRETVAIRAVDGSFELKGTSSIDLFGFTQKCDSKQGYAESIAQLTLPLEIEADPNDSLERVTTLLRAAVARGLEVAVAAPSEKQRHPPLSVIWEWGKFEFRGVIESLSVKYTMFMPDGTPARATMDLRLKQAGRAMNKEQASEGGKPGTKKQPDCSPQR